MDASNQTANPIPVGPDEKSTSVMVYTNSSLYWGEVVTKNMIRVSTWLRTNAAPDRIALHRARSLITTSAQLIKPITYTEVNLSISQVLAFHIAPPGKDPVDFDPTEMNRKMEPVTCQVGSFLIKGKIRMATSADLRKYLEIAREAYTALYDAEITNILLPTIGPIQTPYVLVRQDQTVFAQ
ncbi:MAG: hypothetical protein HY835_12775 [Anaerolineae bacterium]|nr:hypothetical protein [Anaerolineae bacterium]